jgi:hypothetical protein
MPLLNSQSLMVLLVATTDSAMSPIHLEVNSELQLGMAGTLGKFVFYIKIKHEV